MPRNEKHYFICQTCNKEFHDPRHAHRNPKYCSQKCRGIGLQKRNEIKCKHCGKKFQALQSNENRQYCSRECRDKGIIDQSKKTIFVCDWCNKEFETWTYRRPRFCSRQCTSEFAAHQPKPNARRPENFITLNCNECGKPYTVHKIYTEQRNSYFCSAACKGKDQAKKMSGKKNPNWKGGFNPDDYGPNWGSQSRKARKRDNYTCQVCGYKSRIRNLDVHHIKPLVTFNGDYLSANKLSNLICLCRKCHREVEHNKIPCPLPKGL